MKASETHAGTPENVLFITHANNSTGSMSATANSAPRDRDNRLCDASEKQKKQNKTQRQKKNTKSKMHISAFWQIKIAISKLPIGTLTDQTS